MVKRYQVAWLNPELRMRHLLALTNICLQGVFLFQIDRGHDTSWEGDLRTMSWRIPGALRVRFRFGVITMSMKFLYYCSLVSGHTKYYQWFYFISKVCRDKFHLRGSPSNIIISARGLPRAQYKQMIWGLTDHRQRISSLIVHKVWLTHLLIVFFDLRPSFWVPTVASSFAIEAEAFSHTAFDRSRRLVDNFWRQLRLLYHRLGLSN